jgi:hypothetical protein
MGIDKITIDCVQWRTFAGSRGDSGYFWHVARPPALALPLKEKQDPPQKAVDIRSIW